MIPTSSRADPGHRALIRSYRISPVLIWFNFSHLETVVGSSGIWNLDQRILHNSTITITATTAICHLDLSITLSSNPRSPARSSSDNIVNLDQTRKLRNRKSHFKITDVGTPRRQTNPIRRPLQDRLTWFDHPFNVHTETPRSKR